jgi:hypothetical protein
MTGWIVVNVDRKKSMARFLNAVQFAILDANIKITDEQKKNLHSSLIKIIKENNYLLSTEVK